MDAVDIVVAYEEAHMLQKQVETCSRYRGLCSVITRASPLSKNFSTINGEMEEKTVSEHSMRRPRTTFDDTCAANINWRDTITLSWIIKKKSGHVL